MAEQDLKATYEQLSALLLEHRLGWLVQLVEAQIAAGKTIVKSVMADTEVRTPDLEVLPRRRVRTRLLGSVEYTAEERLLLLVDAIRRVVTAASQLEMEVLRISGADALVFVDEGTGEEAVRVQRSDVAVRAASGRKLDDFVSQLSPSGRSHE